MLPREVIWGKILEQHRFRVLEWSRGDASDIDGRPERVSFREKLIGWLGPKERSMLERSWKLIRTWSKAVSKRPQSLPQSHQNQED
jgi:hypothetical protein